MTQWEDPNEQKPVARTIVRHAASDALMPTTAQMLGRLGYRIVAPDAFESLRSDEPGLTADLLLVDERELAEIGTADEGAIAKAPIILLCGRQGATGADRRVVGAVKRPAGLHDLYRLIQQIFEDTPRTTPRVATHFRAQVTCGEDHWEGRVLSLSENGCLLRTGESILLGQRMRLELALPQSGPIAVEAEATYQLLPDMGLVFHAVEPSSREALTRFVSQTILDA